MMNDSIKNTARPDASIRMGWMLLLFVCSGMAALIYEVIWFQLLRLVIGGNAQSLGVLLACFMGGLFLGSYFYGRLIPLTRNPLKAYAVMELGIAVCGVIMPYAIAWLRDAYLGHAHSPEMAMLLRCLICAALLAPPTILMGATLPAISRWVRVDEMQTSNIGKLYAANTLGAVLGAFGAAVILLPWLEIAGTNAVAIGLNILVAAVAWGVSRGYRARPHPMESEVLIEDRGNAAIYWAYGLNGLAALSFEVLWSRLLAMSLAATVYAFALVLSVFLLALALGSATGSALAPRIRQPRRAFGNIQLLIAAAVSGTALLLPTVSLWWIHFDLKFKDTHVWLLTLTNLGRVAVVVFPGAFLWGMSFPMAVAALGNRLQDSARPVGKLFAFNTVGAVLGSLLTSFVLFPMWGSSRGVAILVLIPLFAAAILYWPSKKPTWWAAVPAAVGLGFAWLTVVPTELYMLGRHYGYQPYLRNHSEILVFEEGTMEPLVVYRGPTADLHISINSKTCATTIPEDMITQRLLGHLPVILSQDPSHSLVVGLGAGITAGAVSIHDSVETVDIIELERKIPIGASAFGAYNDFVLDNSKVQLHFDDGRHFIATSDQKYGVITSDPVDPWIAGAAALYSVEYFQLCRDHLNEGGVFTQWLGLYEIGERGLRAILAAFLEVYPEGTLWVAPTDLLLVGSTDDMRIDVEALRTRFQQDPGFAASMAYVGIYNAEDLLGHFLCTIRSLEDELKDVKPNRDDNLLLQYIGWQTYYQANLPKMRELVFAKRKQDPDMYLIPPQEKPALLRALDQRWNELNPP